jgi:hypothetical protein
MEIALGVLMLIIVLVLLIGWTVPLIIGIVKLRRGSRTTGIILTVLGGGWGLVAVLLVAVGIFGYMTAMKAGRTEHFNPDSYKGAIGRIVSKCPSPSHLVVQYPSLKKNLELKSKEGIFIAPVGDCLLESYRLESKDSEGKEWTASGILAGELIKVDSKIEANVEIGPPFTASVTARDLGKKVIFTLIFTDCKGRSATVRKPPTERAPSFALLDKTGQTLWQGSFEYG